MAKRKSTSKWYEKLIIAIVCLGVACVAGLYVWLAFRATAIEKKATTSADKYFSILYVDFDNTLILSDLYGEGLTRQVPTEPTREGYTFQGWETESSSTIYSTTASVNLIITHDIEFKAVYAPLTYTIKYLDSDFSEITTLKYSPEDKLPTIDNPIKDGYVFTGWDYGVNGDETTAVAMYVDSTSNYICRVGNTYYTSLQEAINSIDDVPYSTTDSEMYYAVQDVFATGEGFDTVYFNDYTINLFRNVTFDEVSKIGGGSWGTPTYTLMFNVIDDVKLDGSLKFEKMYALFNTNNYNLEIESMSTYDNINTAFIGNNLKVNELKLGGTAIAKENLLLYGSLEGVINCSTIDSIIDFRTVDSLNSKIDIELTFNKTIEEKNADSELIRAVENVAISDMVTISSTAGKYNPTEAYLAEGTDNFGNYYKYYYWKIIDEVIEDSTSEPETEETQEIELNWLRIDYPAQKGSSLIIDNLADCEFSKIEGYLYFYINGSTACEASFYFQGDDALIIDNETGIFEKTYSVEVLNYGLLDVTIKIQVKDGVTTIINDTNSFTAATIYFNKVII